MKEFNEGKRFCIDLGDRAVPCHEYIIKMTGLEYFDTVCDGEGNQVLRDGEPIIEIGKIFVPVAIIHDYQPDRTLDEFRAEKKILDEQQKINAEAAYEFAKQRSLEQVKNVVTSSNMEVG